MPHLVIRALNCARFCVAWVIHTHVCTGFNIDLRGGRGDLRLFFLSFLLFLAYDTAIDNIVVFITRQRWKNVNDAVAD